ncbi:MAG: tRNA ((37)-N6)-threonylcarbamoyltransferase complex dimerization subunit type 1 TsaB [Bacteroidota bacterium]|jgi:tRNA threonylcarbamoyladenosine biosynthesis protein TsaB
MNYILHLETSTKACSVAISCDGKLIAFKESLTDAYAHSESLTLYIQEVMNSARIEINQLKAVSVTSGPGSYTGLRIGVSTAKGLCYALSIPLIAVDSLVSLATLAKQKYPTQNLCALIDARRMEVFSAIYDSDLKILKSISADVLEDENEYAQYEPFVYFGDGAQKMEEHWKNRYCSIDTEIHASAKGQISSAFQKFQNAEFENVAYFEPFYLKDFVSTQKKA